MKTNNGSNDNQRNTVNGESRVKTLNVKSDVRAGTLSYLGPPVVFTSPGTYHDGPSICPPGFP